VTCQAVAEFISEYLDGELPADTRREFERHVDLCPACQEYIVAFTRAAELGRAVCDAENASAVDAGVPEDLVAAILAARRS